MWIMTANGWRQMQPKAFVAATEPTAAHGICAPYTGTFPSADLCAFNNELKDKMVYFDDGDRMVYQPARRPIAVQRKRLHLPISVTNRVIAGDYADAFVA